MFARLTEGKIMTTMLWSPVAPMPRRTYSPLYSHWGFGAKKIRSNFDAAALVAERRDFDGNSMHGRNATVAGHEVYVVYSFATPILAWVKVGRRTYLWDNECTHSSYTSRHRSHAMFSHSWGGRKRVNNLMGVTETYAFGHSGRRGDVVWDELCQRIALVHGVKS